MTNYYIFKRLCAVFSLICLYHSVNGQVQRGKVLNTSDSAALASVTIKNLRTQQAVQSAANGMFSIPANSSDSLVFSRVGYVSAFVRANTNELLTVFLGVLDRSMDEVVVVGYGTLKKRSVIGSVVEIKGDAIKDRPSANVTRSLQGMVPGLNILPTDGKPNHGGGITIRGQSTSFKARREGGGEYSNTLGQGGGALIIIDGVEGDLTAVNPEDVASVSVLKDASSAAVYGARGAFGVILVTTKQAKSGKPAINYTFNQSVQQRTVLWEDGIVADPVEWINGFRESNLNAAIPNGTVPPLINNYFSYSDQWFEELKRRQADPTLDNYDIDANGNYIYYGSTNWLSEFYKRRNTSSSHAISFTGGSEFANFYLSGRYYTQDGIYKVGNEDFKKYNVRARGSIRLKPWLTVDNNSTLYRNIYLQPMMHYGQLVVPRQVDMFAFPVAIPKNPDGTWTQTAARSGYAAFSEGTSFQYDNNMEVFNSTSLKFDILPSVFNVRANFSYKAIRSQRQRAENRYTYYNGLNASAQDHDLSSLEDWRYNTDYIAANIVGTYTPRLGDKHELNIVGGWNLEETIYKNQKIYRTGNLYPAKPGFTLMDGDYYSATSGGNTWGLIGLFSRINYSFNRKYLAEFSFRYDGSSKFPKNSQWGFFPSASLGWLISQEDWFDNTLGSIVNNMKIRASFGALGNANISPYQFLEVMNFEKSSVLIDGQKLSFTQVPSLIPDDITWEKIKTYNIGLDFSLLNNRLTFTGDYYKRYSSDLYTLGPNLPQVLGSASPKGNYASSKTNGWEVSLGWSDKIATGKDPIRYNIKAMMWDSRTWITDYYNANGDLTTYYKGMDIGEIWGFKTAGIYASNADAKNGPAYNFFKNGEMFQAYAGDLIFVDTDGDGIMTKGSRTLASHGDMAIIGNNSPRYNFGFNLSLNWKGFGLSTFLQGVLKRDWYPWTESGFFWGQHNRSYNSLMKTQTGDNIVQIDKSTENWQVTNMDKDPYWTRRVSLAANRNDGPLTWENSHYLQNVAYVRLKNITIDYTLPAKWMKKTGFTAARFYLTGENLWTYSPMFRHTKMFDPEVLESGDTDFAASTTSGLNGTGNGYSYPMLKNLTLGISVNF